MRKDGEFKNLDYCYEELLPFKQENNAKQKQSLIKNS